jgi:UDP-N-acetyl-D-mannosaminuronic acid dehydrogenase
MKPESLLEKVLARQFRIGILGLGRVGLPLGIAFARKGISVVGIDRDERLLTLVEGGKLPFSESGGLEALKEVLTSQKLSVTADCAALQDVDVIFITVATGLNTEMRVDYSQVRSALKALCPQLRPVQLLLMRSTVPPGTLEKVVKPLIETDTNLEVGREILLGSAPERIAAGRALIELETLPEIVGGLDPLTTRIAAEVMRCLSPAKQIHMTDPVSAELAKLFTNVYRYVTFAVANEFALLAEHYARDAHGIIRMINDGYARGGIPLPGPCGGPCLAKDGYLLLEEISFPDFILTAWKLNEGIPYHMVHRLKDALRARGKALVGAKVAVLGMSFKADIDDLRQSPSLRIVEILRLEGADVVCHDPYHETPPAEDAVAGADAVVLATNHTAFRDLQLTELQKQTKPDCVFVDCWGQWTDRDGEARVVTLGRGGGS